jgi:CheY-like chemotaxis protein
MSEIGLLESPDKRLRECPYGATWRTATSTHSAKKLHRTSVQLLEKLPRSSCPWASILIVDDVAEWRAHVRKILEKHTEWQIVAEACDGLQATQRAAELNPDLVLLDIGMPVMSGLEAATQIQQISPKSRIVFLTQESDATYGQQPSTLVRMDMC